jgi:hypothetical protein
LVESGAHDDPPRARTDNDGRPAQDREQGFVALPLHDEFIVEESRRGDLLEAMAAQLQRVLTRG